MANIIRNIDKALRRYLRNQLGTGRTPYILVGLALLLAAFIFHVAVCDRLMKPVECRFWPTSEGQISISTVIHGVREPGHRGPRIYYTPNVKYTFAVNDHEYTGNRIHVTRDHRYDSPSEAIPIANQYKAGDSVVVFYDPNNPQDAVLDIGANWELFICILGLIVIYSITGIFALYIFYVALFPTKQKGKS